MQLRQPIADDYWRPYLVFRPDVLHGLPGDGWTFTISPADAENLAAVLRHAVEVMNSYDDPDGASS